MEINMIIYFSSTGNQGKRYENYGVRYLDRSKRNTQPGRAIRLGEVLGKTEISENYPHTVKYYLDSTGIGKNFAPVYLEERIIRNEEEFFRFLKDLGI
jgi:hypothetical protein